MANGDPNRRVGEDSLITVYLWGSGTWQTGVKLAHPTTAVEGMCRRWTLEETAATHDVSGISDPYTKLRPGRVSGRCTLEKLVSTDFFFTQSSPAKWRTRQAVKIACQSWTGATEWVFIGFITSISATGEDGPQIESMTAEGFADGYVA